MSNYKNVLDKFDIDATQSWTLPGSFYFDPKVYAHELEAIFYQTWQYACHASQLTTPGDYVVRDLGDQSVMLVRDTNQIKAYHNVCQHRAHRLLEGEGQTGKHIVCPYHTWCYGLDGELINARGSGTMPDFPIHDIHLQQVVVDQLAGFVFFNLDSRAKPLSEMFPGLEDEILALAPDAKNLCKAHSQDFNLAANWKNSIENYSECYHCPNRHPTLVNEALDISQYKIDIRSGYHRHITADVGDKQGYKITENQTDQPHEFGSWFMFPNMVFEVYPGGNLTIFNHLPAGPERTIQQTEWYFANAIPTSAEREVIDFINIVREEDIPICESVQRGLHSKGYQQGKFIVDENRSFVSEHAVHDFQLRVAKALQLL